MTYETIVFTKKYKDLNEVLYWIVEQAKAGVEYAENNFPEFDNPVDLYNYLKSRVTFHSDPKNKELIQNPGTLFENNYHGKPGHGDCDCFVTLLLSTLWANGFNENYILLYGRSRSNPSHISLGTVYKGEFLYMDLTEPRVNKERFYPYFQEIPVF